MDYSDVIYQILPQQRQPKYTVRPPEAPGKSWAGFTFTASPPSPFKMVSATSLIVINGREDT